MIQEQIHFLDHFLQMVVDQLMGVVYSLQQQLYIT